MEFEENFLGYIKNIYGSDCYDPNSRTILINGEDLKVKLKFPDVKSIISNNDIDLWNSGYLIN